MLGCDCRVCKSSDSRNRRTRPSVLIQGSAQIVIDSGTDFRSQIMRHPISRLDAVLFTHWHADHILGLDDIRPFNYWQKGAIPIYGNARTLQRIRETFSYIFDGTSHEGAPKVEARAIDGPLDINGMRIEPLEIIHGRLAILGFRISNFAYITDASFIPEETIRRIRNVDCVVLNALRHTPHFAHFSVNQAVEQIGKIQPRQAFLTHISHQLDHEEVERSLPPQVRLAYDGLTLEL